MSRAAAVSIENNFSKGLITEATAMNFPENSVADADNCVFLKNGKVIRRWGIDFEDNYDIASYLDLSVMGNALDPHDYYEDVSVVEFEWTNVSQDGNISFMVMQLGDRVVIYNVDDTNTISSNLKSTVFDISAFRVGAGGDEGQAVSTTQVTFSSGFGYLFVAHPLCNPFYIAYNPSTDSFTSAAITIKIRDFERLDDGLDLDERPTTISHTHKYNLYNQGWYISAQNATPATGNVLTYWDAARADYPANSDIWWASKNASEIYDSTWIDKKALGNTPAPNGHYIYNAFSFSRNPKISVTDLPEPKTNYRPSCSAFFAGRVWYAGVPDPNYSSNIYFSALVQGVTDFGVCYQAGDPTSENNDVLLEIDGGVIVIPDIARIYRLVAVASTLLVFASNGVWKISGPSGVFTATSYSIEKVSSASITAPHSVIVAEGLPFWWDKAGIYNIQFDPTSNQELVVNVSESTIQTLINNIPDDNLSFVKGAYNNINKNVHWLYRSTPPVSNSDNYKYDKLLVLNLTTQSFSPQTISDSVPGVAGLIFTSKSNHDPLLTEKGASVVKFVTIGSIADNDQKGVTFSQFNRDTYEDWDSYAADPFDYTSYFITGYRIRGDLLRKFQSNYIVVIADQETNASCLVQGVWDYANSPLTGQYTTSQQIFKGDTSKDYSRRKLKMRGNGYSLQFKFRSEAGKPFTLNGWTTSDTGNNVP